MKINLIEDTIDGDVQDGSINMKEELDKLLEKIAYRFGARSPEIGRLFESDEITTGRIEMLFRQEDQELKWYPIGYYNEEDDREIIYFEFSKNTIANCYRYIVNLILKEFPEIKAYGNLLGDYHAKCYDFDIFAKDAIIAGNSFFDNMPDFAPKMKAHWPLDIYLENRDEIAESYVIPHDIEFEEDFRDAYYHTLKRIMKIAKAFQNGTFEGRTYYFRNIKPHISVHYRAYDEERKIMRKMFNPSVQFWGINIDGEDVQDKIIPYYDRENKMNPETEYLMKLDSHLKRAFEKFKIRYN